MSQDTDNQRRPTTAGPTTAPAGAYVTGGAEFNRDTNYIEDRITRDGRPGANGEPGWPVEPGRYRLVAARACPWANRTVIVRRLLGLEDVISLGQPGPTHDARSWTFDLDPGGKDPVLGIERHAGRLLPPFPGLPARHHRPCDGGCSQRRGGDQQLPADHAGLLHRVDRIPPAGRPGPLSGSTSARRSTRSTSACSPRSTTASTAAGSPAPRRPTTPPTTGSGQRWTGWRSGSPASVTWWVTPSPRRTSGCSPRLARFDAVYHGHFKCNRQKLSEMPALWGYARDLFQTPGFGDTTDFVQIKQHYYIVHEDINPTGIVPAGSGPVRVADGRTAGRPSAAAPSATARRRDPSRPARKSRPDTERPDRRRKARFCLRPGGMQTSVRLRRSRVRKPSGNCSTPSWPRTRTTAPSWRSTTHGTAVVRG